MQRKRIRGERGFSLDGIAVAIILILVAVVVPGRGAIRTISLETAAIRMIGTIHDAQTEYHAQYRKYASTLTQLGPPANGRPGPSAAGLIAADLAAGKKVSYLFTMQSSPTGYIVNANPEVYNRTGRRTFFSDQTQVIRQNWGPEPATIQSSEVK